MALKLQRLFLLLGALGWSASLVFVCAPTLVSVKLLHGIGLTSPFTDPLLQYWLRMSGGAFFLIGVLFLLPIWKREKYEALIPILGIFSIVEATILCLTGLYLEIPKLSFATDSLFCFSVGAGLLYTQLKISQQMHLSNTTNHN